MDENKHNEIKASPVVAPTMASQTAQTAQAAQPEVTACDHCHDRDQMAGHYRRKPLLILVVVLLVLTVIVGSLAVKRAFITHVGLRGAISNQMERGADSNSNFIVERGNGMRGNGMGDGGMRGGRQFGSGVQANSLVGVVTAVNGSGFTVAGDGTTETVNTSSDTRFVGATSVKVNDSVRVLGTVSGSTWTATGVFVNR